MKMIKQNNQGFTLIEVLVAVLVFSFGLLGIAGMMTISVKSNHNGYLRSQANFLAENMVDRMPTLAPLSPAAKFVIYQTSVPMMIWLPSTCSNGLILWRWHYLLVPVLSCV